ESVSTTAAKASERRPKSRKQVLMGAVIAYDEGRHAFDCTIRDISETGARIAIPRNRRLPQDFFLINMKDRVAYEARIARNNGADTGVAFTRTLKLTSITDPSLRFLNRLWLERATR